MCNFRSQKHIDTESFTVLYDERVCRTFLEYTFEPIKEKYFGIYKSVLLLDEFNFILTGTRLIEDDLHRKSLG